ncbi:MAG: hypothetical protein E7211_05350 [Clostridium lundense]|nr:hypothetical protein [Clostridium lundense]
MKEIGGYFGLEQLINNKYYKNLISLNNARNALIYILRAKKIKKLYIPYYLCSEVRDILIYNNYDFEYYNIDSNFMPRLEKSLSDNQYIYIVNYYGQLENDKIIALKHKYNKIILDNTHAFFQRPIEHIDIIYNCRKFFGVPDGAYLSTDTKIKDDLEIDVSKNRMTHILGRYEGTASEYYNDFQNNDRAFKSEPLKYMSKLTDNILGAIDYERVRQTRTDNYMYLESKLKKHNKLELLAPDGAFAYPFYIKNGIDIRKELAKKKIYVPTLWPNVLTDTPEESIEYDYVENVLPLPCDQRYNIEDMEYILKEIKKCID